MSKSPSGPPLGSQSGGDKQGVYSCEARAPAVTAQFWQNHLTCVTESPIAKREVIVTPALLAPLRCCKVQSPHRCALIPAGEMVLSRAATRSKGRSPGSCPLLQAPCWSSRSQLPLLWLNLFFYQVQIMLALFNVQVCEDQIITRLCCKGYISIKVQGAISSSSVTALASTLPIFKLPIKKI